ncbi:MAG: pyruvate, water dikinase [Nitrospiraceae bacterium]|nr:MAG: pyruvate, water dikinase [Nitrospiraceae bacterium]
MFRLKRFFKKHILREKDSPVYSPSIEELRTAFKTRYWSFKTLLKANNEILEIMADMERVLRSGRSFGMSFIRANCTALSVNLFKIIQNLNIIGDNHYKELYSVSEGIWAEINGEVEKKTVIQGKEIVLPIDKITSRMADQAGSKMANLGELRNRPGFHVPDGFVITAWAYEKFIEHNRIQQEINRRIQTLDADNMERLHRSSSEIQTLIMQGNFPEELQDEIMAAYQKLEARTHKGVTVSMRSSAVGEDSRNVSFAGQYRSELNVSRDFILYTYKEIIASKYTLQAISYRLNRGFRDEDIPMCVGCMEMVDAVSGGVMYSRDPRDFHSETVLIHSAPGLAKSVVEGSVSPDIFTMSRKVPGKIIGKSIQPKEIMVTLSSGDGVTTVQLAPEQKNSPSISDNQAVSLSEIAIGLEDHFGGPQDIEWAIDLEGSIKILQTRPLQKSEKHVSSGTVPDNIGNDIIINTGITASGGTACGQAFLVHTALDMLQFPKGAILIVKYPSPQWASVLPHSVAVIADTGSITGHLATVAREFRVPALFNTGDASQKIKTGDLLTLDADNTRIYSGEVKQLLQHKVEHAGLMSGSPVYTLLESILKLVTPLHLTDPESVEFKPRNCKTVHDITRFCHEMSVREMFDFGKDHAFAERSSKRLLTDIPMQWWILNLEDGLKGDSGGESVRLEDIVSEPMLAIWKGINAFKWAGPPPVDSRGFMSMVFEATMNRELEPSMQTRYADRNYFMISRNFCNLSSRLGFHFSIIEAYTDDYPKNNYISFNFKGGAADHARKIRRVEFIGRVLRQYGFRTEINEDTVLARLEDCDRDSIKEHLKVLGYLVIHTRQLDMIMNNEALVSEYFERFIKDINSFVHIPF